MIGEFSVFSLVPGDIDRTLSRSHAQKVKDPTSRSKQTTRQCHLGSKILREKKRSQRAKIFARPATATDAELSSRWIVIRINQECLCCRHWIRPMQRWPSIDSVAQGSTAGMAMAKGSSPFKLARIEIITCLIHFVRGKAASPPNRDAAVHRPVSARAHQHQQRHCDRF